MGYLFGVDGGNTKTDYFLFSSEGKLIAKRRGGTCSHEQFSEGFEMTYKIMSKEVEAILSENGLEASDIDAACFGLAGCDVPFQKKKLEEVVEKIGFKKYVVVNDSFLGIKAGTTNGYGVSSVNGTGTCCGGIDKNGKVLQIGGIGGVTGDYAGGRQISRDVMARVFDEAYRMGDKTSLTPIVFNALELTDKEGLEDAIVAKFFKRGFDYNQLTLACFDEADKGDKVAIDILQTMGHCLAKTVSGCITNMDFGDEPEVVMIGSVYVKPTCHVLNDEFKRRVLEYTKKNCKFKVLEVPPATGAIIWAKELYDGVFPSIEVRKKIIKELED